MADREGVSLTGPMALAIGGLAAGLITRSLVRRRRAIDLRDKVVLITGGSRGLGFVLARQFLQEGARVAICARDEAELRGAQMELQRHGQVLTVIADITQPETLVRLVDQVKTTLGPVDVLVNNAGIVSVGPIETMTLADFDECMAIHFRGPLELIYQILPEMRRRRQGRIVNITSIGGKIPTPHMVPYAASKYALVGLSESLRTELIKDNIYVTTVVPGLMRTGSPRNAFFKGRHEDEFAWFATSDVTPGVTINAERMARDIVNACRYGQSELIRPLAACLQAKLYALMPGIGADIAATINNLLLPAPGGIGTHRRRGFESDSSKQPQWARVVNKANATTKNQLIVSQEPVR